MCCCAIGKAFGACEKCPSKNSDEYKSLCGRSGHVIVKDMPVGNNCFRFVGGYFNEKHFWFAVFYLN